MGYYNTTATYSTSGVKTITPSPSFTPTGYRITVSAKNGDVFAHMSIGMADATDYATYHAFIQDTTGGKTDKGSGFNGKVVSIWERVSGTLTEVGSATHDSFTSTSIKFNVTTPHSGYQYNIEVWG